LRLRRRRCCCAAPAGRHLEHFHPGGADKKVSLLCRRFCVLSVCVCVCWDAKVWPARWRTRANGRLVCVSAPADGHKRLRRDRSSAKLAVHRARDRRRPDCRPQPECVRALELGRQTHLCKRRRPIAAQNSHHPIWPAVILASLRPPVSQCELRLQFREQVRETNRCRVSAEPAATERPERKRPYRELIARAPAPSIHHRRQELEDRRPHSPGRINRTTR
jgi:hypothetical protein